MKLLCRYLIENNLNESSRVGYAVLKLTGPTCVLSSRRQRTRRGSSLAPQTWDLGRWIREEKAGVSAACVAWRRRGDATRAEAGEGSSMDLPPQALTGRSRPTRCKSDPSSAMPSTHSPTGPLQTRSSLRGVVAVQETGKEEVLWWRRRGDERERRRGGAGRLPNLVDVERRLQEFAEIFQRGATSSPAQVLCDDYWPLMTCVYHRKLFFNFVILLLSSFILYYLFSFHLLLLFSYLLFFSLLYFFIFLFCGFYYSFFFSCFQFFTV